MGSHTVLVHVVTRRTALAVVLLLSVSRIAFAQAELSGTWAPRNFEDISRDSYPVDYLGLPLNDEGRTRALSYNEAQLAMFEHQCEGWPAVYFVQGPFGLKIWSDIEPVKGTTISFTIGAWEDRAPITIWMDGRPHPSAYAEHTRGGFTTGTWEGTFAVGDREYVIGRASSSEIQLSHASVSRTHARITPRAGAHAIVDRGSTSGTLVNGVKVDGEHELHDGDVVKVGALELRYEKG